MALYLLMHLLLLLLLPSRARVTMRHQRAGDVDVEVDSAEEAIDRGRLHMSAHPPRDRQVQRDRQAQRDSGQDCLVLSLSQQLVSSAASFFTFLLVL